MAPEVFISYSSKDRERVFQLVQRFREAGVSVWIDQGNIDGALLWGQEIVDAIESCKVLILFASSESVNSHNVFKEVALASENNKSILPLYLERVVIPKAMRYQLAGIQHIELFRGNDRDNFEAILRSLVRLGVGTEQRVTALQTEVGELHQFVGHTGLVDFVVFLPDGRRAFSKGRDGIRFWDLDSGDELPGLNNFSLSENTVFTPDSRRALSKGDRLQLYDLENGKELIGSEEETMAAYDAVFSPSFRRVLSCKNLEGVMRLWDAENGREIGDYKVGGLTEKVSFSPDGSRALLCTTDKTVRLWDLDGGRELHRLKHDDYVSATFLPDGRRAITHGRDNPVRLWDLEKGKEIYRLKGHAGDISSVSLSPDGRRVLTGSYDMTIRLWDVETGRELGRLEETRFVFDVLFSPDGRRAISNSAGAMIRLWDLESGKELYTFNDHLLKAVKFSPDGRRVLSFGLVDFVVRLLDATNGGEIAQFKHTHMVSSAAFSPDGRRALSGAGDSVVRLWALPR